MFSDPPSGSLAERELALVAVLETRRDPQARLAWAVDRARQRPPLPEALRRDEHRVDGCLARLWLVKESRDGRGWFHSDSDAVTLKALTGLLCEVASGARLEEVAGWKPDFLDRLGLLRQLADSRRATVLRVAELMRQFASRSVVLPPGS